MRISDWSSDVCSSDLDRKAVRGVARPGIIAFDVALLAAALGDDLAMLQEGVGQADRLVEQAAGVGAKVEDVAQGLAAERLLDAGEGGEDGVRRRLVAGVDVADADKVLHFPFDGGKLDRTEEHTSELQSLMR